MKTYKATVTVVGEFTSVQTVKAGSREEARRLLASGQGQNKGDAYDWDTWREVDYMLDSTVEEADDE